MAPIVSSIVDSTNPTSNNDIFNGTHLSRTSIIVGVSISSVALLVSLTALIWYLVWVRKQTRAAAAIAAAGVKTPEPSIIESNVTVKAIKGGLDTDTDFDVWRYTTKGDVNTDSDSDVWRYRASWESTTGRSAFDNDRESVSTGSKYSVATEDAIDWTLIQPC